MWQSNTNFQAFSVQFSQQLESLRGISAIIVLFSHCFQAFIAPFDATIYSFVRLFGQAGVMMFFALSGYLIGHSIQKNQLQNTTFDLKHYIKQRCKRILPPFIFALALTAILYVLAPYFFASGSREFVHNFGFMIRENYDIDLADFVGTTLFLNGFLSNTISANAPLWSLSYEVWFYVLAGFIPFILSANHQAKIIFGMLILAVLSWLNLQFLIYFLVWVFAFSLSYLDCRLALQSILKQIQYLFLSCALAITAFDFYQFHFLYLAQEYTTENFTIFNMCIGISFSCWLARLQLQDTYFKSILPHSARFSYTLYVTHFPVLIFLIGCFPQTLNYGLSGGILSCFLSLLILIIFAWILASFLEPKIHFGSKP